MSGSIPDGEHPNGRRAMDDITRRLRNEGMPSKQAEEKARETARRMDRQNNGRPS